MLKGYDFRHFVTTSIPTSIMEVLTRCFYTVKQVSKNNKKFGETIIETMPMKMNPKFRYLLTIAYGTFASVNAGKMCITKNILDINYSGWMNLIWHSFHSLKWALYDSQIQMWTEIEKQEIQDIENLISNLTDLENRAEFLPI